MTRWKKFTGITLATLVLVSPLATQAARVDIDVDIAPPPPRYEVVPPPRVGYIWAPGYWGWDGQRHVWHGGRFMREHHGEHWVNHEWEEHNGHYRYHEGHWERG